jgi:hypothetical protein
MRNAWPRQVEARARQVRGHALEVARPSKTEFRHAVCRMTAALDQASEMSVHFGLTFSYFERINRQICSPQKKEGKMSKIKLALAIAALSVSTSAVAMPPSVPSSYYEQSWSFLYFVISGHRPCRGPAAMWCMG